ncbi:hypothetical protein [Phenylobacterium soli]|uniref:Uncharacterized protein n=1 Tax=Phenylobacterium soli TaxID=2170551 RepID=A0A328AQ76_9CAUL|nr:hypothetical protein [Phenylobacterium soli]RAK55038.1 hypothetical protein DJ017_11160 [Phenylobacterium soli]
MTSKKLVLAAASACAALVGLTATAASAQQWGPSYGYQGYGYQRDYRDYRDDRFGGGSVDALLQREDRLGGWIRRMSYEGRLDRDESRRAWGMLSDARGQTMHEAREHGRVLPGRDYREISERLNGLERFLRHEAREDWDD